MQISHDTSDKIDSANHNYEREENHYHDANYTNLELKSVFDTVLDHLKSAKYEKEVDNIPNSTDLPHPISINILPHYNSNKIKITTVVMLIYGCIMEIGKENKLYEERYLYIFIQIYKEIPEQHCELSEELDA